MTTLEQYIIDNNLENHSQVANIRALFNASIKVYRLMVAKGRCVTDHKNSSVNFLAGYAAGFTSANRFKLNTEVFDYRWITEKLAQLLRDEPTAQPSPWE